ncbi:VanZ family protein [Candidatus Roizmanbacteria bacterium]|nr:VanZ family protein [Candidatus Roizmanbacteria bacterium]
MDVRQLRKLILYWLPPLFWMIIIFYLSSRMSVKVTGTLLYDFLIFKGLHMIEYAFLYFLLFRAFFSIENKNITLKQKLIFPLIISLFYALSDEIHQTFVPTREGKIRDVIIDSFGIVLMYIYIKSNLKLVKRFLP